MASFAALARMSANAMPSPNSIAFTAGTEKASWLTTLSTEPKNGEPTPLEELNAAAAVAAAVGAQLVQQHITFSAAVPTRNGLEIYEVRTQKDFQQMLMHWMCFPLQQTEGAGMRYFLPQQMDRQYARLVLLTAGQYTASLKPLEGRIGTTVISAVSGGKLQHIAVGGGCEVVELPAERIEDEVYRILC